LFKITEYGGIYLDFDEVLLRPIDSLRRFQHTQGHELKRTMGSQVVMSKKNATFLNLWYKSYRDDYKKIWAYNALWVPNTLAKNHPELIHVEGFNFTRPNWQNTKLIYDGNYNWATNYGMHMYARWYRRPINLDIIRTLNTTVGAVSRHILFGNKELCII
jgi:mannosyltransferase OCH1-like enzyme